MFHPDNVGRLTAEDFKDFLLFDNNRHWTGISRGYDQHTADMDLLRETLLVLVDETKSLSVRLDQVIGNRGVKTVPGLGQAAITPILHVVYPNRYGVWNSTSERTMIRLGFWPLFGPGWGFGYKYHAVNSAIGNAADHLGVDLWAIDTLWWKADREYGPTRQVSDTTSTKPRTPRKTSSRKPPATATFVCENCFRTKPIRLKADTGRSLCSDCHE